MPAGLWDRRFDQVLALNVDYFTAEQAEALAAVLEYPSQREFGKKQRRNYERRLRRHQQRAAEAEIAWRTAAGKAIPLRLTEAAQR